MKPEALMKPLRGYVGCVCEKPRFMGAEFASPGKAGPDQSSADASTSMIRVDDESDEVVAARSDVSWFQLMRLKPARPSIPDDQPSPNSNEQATLAIIEISSEPLNPADALAARMQHRQARGAVKMNRVGATDDHRR